MLTYIVIVSLISFGATELLRGTVFKRPFEKGVKPFSCNLCMSTWMSAIALLVLYLLHLLTMPTSVLIATSSFGLTMVLLRRFGRRVVPKGIIKEGP